MRPSVLVTLQRITEDNVHRSHWPGWDGRHELQLGGDKAKLDPFWLINRSYDLLIADGDKLYSVFFSVINPQTPPHSCPLKTLGICFVSNSLVSSVLLLIDLALRFAFPVLIQDAVRRLGH